MKVITLFFISLYALLSYGQNPNIVITLPNPPANTGQWGIGTSVFNIIVSGPNMTMLYSSSVMVTVKSGGTTRCGSFTPWTAPSSNINSTAPKSWIGSAAASLLGQDCLLSPGSYEICIQFYGYRNGVENALILEKCMPFSIIEKD